ncbi:MULTISPECIES: hypothetical protein [unclassified Agrobacterium]|uniref:hypothetical protein n=1 Tax=unclassified Agrobacterium TaxID=2632611 RepID=UPI002448ED45|nr:MULTISPECIES: hypothetical protein [unclassified Agrobacterium]MDH0616472.1 hypothetical protein [Agrobacterium sp. GD03872]MDH0699083.1 hypothetical protein [Agrobacterium sp. GD03871]MDH1061790.1 hypothetical protein [Agrobacterium sp. GD03992]MDH2213387.1 hypothetical protein [Agrobacterium sp. GD03643]MDH2222099.1 hypothetical protein [Agrobacterium sp. GD03638]
MEEIAAAKARQRLLFANIACSLFFRSLAIINICRTQSTRVHLRALAHRLRQIRENKGVSLSDAGKRQGAEICVFPTMALFNPPLRRQKTLNAASAHKADSLL